MVFHWNVHTYQSKSPLRVFGRGKTIFIFFERSSPFSIITGWVRWAVWWVYHPVGLQKYLAPHTRATNIFPPGLRLPHLFRGSSFFPPDALMHTLSDPPVWHKKKEEHVRAPIPLVRSSTAVDRRLNPVASIGQVKKSGSQQVPVFVLFDESWWTCQFKTHMLPHLSAPKSIGGFIFEIAFF